MNRENCRRISIILLGDVGTGDQENIPCKCQREPGATSDPPFGVPFGDVVRFSGWNPVEPDNHVKEDGRDLRQLEQE